MNNENVKIEKISIERFIKEMTSCRNQFDENEQDTVKHLFTNGYCYHFALLLKAAFPGGQIMLCWPRPHVVYQYDKKCYDAHGEYDIVNSETTLIPFTKDIMKDIYVDLRRSFLHNRDCKYPDEIRLCGCKVEPAVTDYRISIRQMIDIYINFIAKDCENNPQREISDICLVSFNSVKSYLDKKVKDINSTIDYWFESYEQYKEVVAEEYVRKKFKQIFIDKLYPVYMYAFLHTSKYDVPSMYPKLLITMPSLKRRESNIIELARSARGPKKN